MAFPNGFSDRNNDDMRYRGPTSPRDEGFPSFNSPMRGFGGQVQTPNQSSSSSDARASLQRRFTTNNIPTYATQLSPIGQQRRQAAEPSDYTTAAMHKVQLLEKKKLEYEYLREQRRRFQLELEIFDMQAQQEEQELNRLSQDLTRVNLGAQSEPTTPPEYNPSAFRPNRFSSASLNLTSPPGIGSNRQSRSGSQHITSPPVFQAQQSSHLPSKSVPGSRRNSDEDEEEDEEWDLPTFTHRLNRNSMPVSGHDQRGRRPTEIADTSSGFNPLNTTRFLFGDEDDRPMAKTENPAASPEAKAFLQMVNKDQFPTLVRQGDNGMQFSTSGALDLASGSQDTGTDQQTGGGWGSAFGARHRQAQSQSITSSEYDAAGMNGAQTPGRSAASNRRSTEVTFSPFTESKGAGFGGFSTGPLNGMPKLQSSYSTNDVPTLKNTTSLNGSAGNSSSITAEQHLHKHNSSMGRIPPGAVSNRQSRDLSLSGGDARIDEQKNNFRPLQSVLHASAAPFGPTSTAPVSSPFQNSSTLATSTAQSPPMQQQYAAPAYYGGYGMNMLGAGMNTMQLQAQQQGQMQGQMQGQWGNQMNVFPGGYGPYGQTYQQQQFPFRDSQARVIQQRRMQNHEGEFISNGDKASSENTRFNHFDLESQRHEIYALCKDQHGCRFLQKKLEERNPESVQIIFEETNMHVVELMMDPFGNYLCQKLLEHTNEDQRTILINNAAGDMVNVALNQHGTRALQKMIEFVSTPAQIQTIIRALEDEVVKLIQDLNGNHVIQKCLNHLAAEDAQFIFDAVGLNCVVVGTHRHGCCVLQRCIDHASAPQRAFLVAQITANSFALVQDPFGNYVVQYILDLGEPAFTEPLCEGFACNVAALSKQKFSSNVIEKCIRVSGPTSRRLMIDELMQPVELEKLLRDSYANYVVQTAMEHADPETKARLIDNIRPIIPSIRSTPYGRRIQTKFQEYEGRLSNGSSGINTPRDGAVAQYGLTAMSPRQGQIMPNQGFYQPNGAFGNGFNSNVASPQPHRLSNAALPNHLQASVQQQSFGYGRQNQTDGAHLGGQGGYNFF